MMITTACSATTRTGEPCRAAAGASGYCWSHDPTLAPRRAEARRAGGRARHGRTIGVVGQDVEPVELRSVADVLALLERTANDLAGLENSINRARAFVALAAVAVRTIETSELEQRLTALEARLSDEASN